MSLDLSLGIARSGLSAAQRALAQASQNIGNAETPGYTRKSIVRVAQIADGTPAGVRVSEGARPQDAALVARLDAARAAAAGQTLRERLVGQVEQAHGTPGDGNSLATAVSALEDGFVALRASPADTGLQRDAAQRAETVAQRLNGLSTAITSARQQAQDAIENEVTTINATLREIASLTTRIKGGVDGAISELEDRRDAAIARLSESLEVRAVHQADGDVVLLARGIAVLPLDPDNDQFSVDAANVAPGAAWRSDGTGTLPGVTLNGLDVTGRLAGGRLGEAITLRDSTLPRLQAEADLAATTLAARFEGQGLRLFTDTDGTVPDTTAGYAGSTQIGFAGRIGVNPDVATDPSLLRDGTHAVAGGGGPDPFTPNPTGGPAGFVTLLDRILDFTFGAEAAPGSPWAGIPTTGLGPAGNLVSPFIAPGSITDYAARITAAPGVERAEATRALDEAATLRDGLETRLRSETGVDVDAEMAGIVTLQNAYAANARVVGAVQAMWDSLLGSIR